MSERRSPQFNISHIMKRSFVFLLVVSFLLIGGVPGALAVDNVLYAKPEATGVGDCILWENACTLQQALTSAVAGDQIWVVAGRHIPTTTGDRGATFQLKNGVTVYGGFDGTELSLDQRDWITNVTILSGDLNGDDDGFINNGENSYNVVMGATLATLDGFTITGGNGYSGGGMYNLNTYPILRNLIIIGNMASFGGGGMTNDYSSPTLLNVTLSGNTCGWNGGGMLNVNSSNPTLTNVTFSGNTAGWGGGGMYNGGYCDPTLTNVTFYSNSAPNAGGIFNYNDSNPTVQNSILWRDSSSEIANDSNCFPIITFSDVQGGYEGLGNIDVDPLLIPLQDNNGNTWMYALRSDSLAIDAGNNTVCPPTDQRGAPRPLDGNGDCSAVCDLGSFEAILLHFYLPVVGR